MDANEALTARSLFVEAQSALRAGEYEIRANLALVEPLGDLCFVGEDEFGVVLVAVYETWSSLSSGWKDAQSTLVKLLTERLSLGNPKAWEGYLALLTPSQSGDERAEDEIRYDTSRVRKIVGTGESIRFIDDVTGVLMPLLPFSEAEMNEAEDPRSVLDRLPHILAERGVALPIAVAVVGAFKADEPLMESIAQALKT